ncbi:hypothetical protein KCP78_13180 [Salmonella enterica subsp. enterica]|nr:hypothetical protein KCP78_13180 [Salmonella enterica subsp. enterica]
MRKNREKRRGVGGEDLVSGLCLRMVAQAARDWGTLIRAADARGLLMITS